MAPVVPGPSQAAAGVNKREERGRVKTPHYSHWPIKDILQVIILPSDLDAERTADQGERGLFRLNDE